MEKVKDFSKNKSVGFYFILASCLLSLILIIVFLPNTKSGYYTWLSFIFLLVAILGDVVLIIFKKEDFAPALNSVCAGLAIGFFINACYNYVATVMTGIDIESFSGDFIFSVILYVLLFGSSIASIFIPLRKNIVDEDSIPDEAI